VDNENAAIIVKNINHLYKSPSVTAALNNPFAVTVISRKWPPASAYNLFSFVWRHAMLGNMLDIPFVPAKIHLVFLYSKLCDVASSDLISHETKRVGIPADYPPPARECPERPGGNVTSKMEHPRPIPESVSSIHSFLVWPASSCRPTCRTSSQAP